MKTFGNKITAVLAAILAFLFSMPKRYMENAVKAGLFAPLKPRAMAMAAGTTANIGYGVTVTWAGHDIGHILSVNGISSKADTVDISDNDSTDAHKEFVAAMVDGGELVIEANFIPGDTTGQKYFRDDHQARTTRAVVFTYPDAISKWTLNAVPAGLDISTPYNDAMTITMTMKISGKPAFTNS